MDSKFFEVAVVVFSAQVAYSTSFAGFGHLMFYPVISFLLKRSVGVKDTACGACVGI